MSPVTFPGWHWAFVDATSPLGGINGHNAISQATGSPQLNERMLQLLQMRCKFSCRFHDAGVGFDSRSSQFERWHRRYRLHLEAVEYLAQLPPHLEPPWPP